MVGGVLGVLGGSLGTVGGEKCEKSKNWIFAKNGQNRLIFRFLVGFHRFLGVPDILGEFWAHFGLFLLCDLIGSLMTTTCIYHGSWFLGSKNGHFFSKSFLRENA